MRTKWLFLYLLTVALTLPVRADTDSLKKLLKDVENRYNHAQTLQVTFHESYKAPQRPVKTESGTLFLRKPGRMRWDYTSPEGKLFISDGKYLYLYTPSANRVEKMKMKESEDMRVPLAFLLGRLDFEKEFRGIQSRPEGSGTLISAQPKSDNLPYTQVEFVINQAHEIQRVQVTGYDKSVIDFRFGNEVMNPKLESRLFQFQMPAGAELVEPAN